MTKHSFSELRGYDGKVLLIRSTEGETIRARVTFVSQSSRDLTFSLLETDRPERYSGDPKGIAYVIPWEFILEITEVAS